MPYLTEVIIQTLASWLSSNPFELPNQTTHPFHYCVLEVYQAQARIGYDNFMRGLLVKEWRILMDDWYRYSHDGVKYNGVRWQKYIIWKLLNAMESYLDEYAVGMEEVCVFNHNVKTSRNKHVDPSLKLYTGCPLMVNSNENLMRDGYGNGTLCRSKGVKLKEGKETYIKNGSGYKFNVVPAGDVEYIICDHSESSDDRPPSTFHVPMMSDIVTIQIYFNGSRIMLNGIQIKKLGVNTNIATVGHKLRGMSKDVIIVVRNEKRKNWLYVVLSRVKTRKGLFLYRKLNMSDIQEPDSSYLNDEPRLKELEQQILTSKEKHRINKK